MKYSEQANDVNASLAEGQWSIGNKASQTDSGTALILSQFIALQGKRSEW